jgi:hypothetical protein
MLKITRKDDPITVSQLIVALYSQPGLGKSTLGFTAESPLLLDFDRGAYRAANRGDSVQVEAWADVAGMVADDLAEYKTVVIDTAGRALDLLSADIIRRNPKMGRGGALTLQGYGQLKSEFTAWLKNLRTMGKDVVLIAHSSEDKSGDDLIERLDIQGGSKGEIYKSADAMARLLLDGGKRVLNFSPTDTTFGKNPGCLAPLRVPDVADNPHFLAGVIDTIKCKLNALSEEQQQRMEAIEGWRARVEAATEADDINDLIGDAKTDPQAATVKGMLHARATALGLIFKDGQYEAAA